MDKVPSVAEEYLRGPTMVQQGEENASFALEFVGAGYSISSSNTRCLDVLRANFAALVVVGPPKPAAICYEVLDSPDGGFDVRTAAAPSTHVSNLYELLYLLEKSITVATQRVRSDLFFLHAAVVEYGGFAFILTAPSGSGKSSTAWALLNRGFGYLSDELAPIDPIDLNVYPYPHALCLKRELPKPFGLPEKVIATEHTFHLETAAFPKVIGKPTPLGGIFLLQFDGSLAAPVIRPVSAGEAAAGIYANGLNQLAHPSSGLAAVARITSAVPAFRLFTAGLEETCGLVKSTIEGTVNQ